MIVEISCEVRDKVHRGRREAFTTSVPSLDNADIRAAIRDKFPGLWCVKEKARVIESPVVQLIAGSVEMVNVADAESTRGKRKRA